jgi:phytoene synthase
MASGILKSGGAPPETFTLDASVAFTIGKILGDFRRHASRRQLYLPMDVLDRHQVRRADVFAGQSSEALRAALAEMRGIARRHLLEAQSKLQSAPWEILPAFLSLAFIGPLLRRMERADYEPFQFEQVAPWRRQWLLWRAARDPSRIFGI